MARRVILSGAIRQPRDYADDAFLVPHEFLRRQLRALSEQFGAVDASTFRSADQLWRVRLLARYIVEYLAPIVEYHHNNEERVVIPQLARHGIRIEGGELDAIAHEELVLGLDAIAASARALLEAAAGDEDVKQLAFLKVRIPEFEAEMNEHFDAEERIFPQHIRSITEQQWLKVVRRIAANDGLGGAKIMLPGVVEAMREWGGDEKVAEFERDIPPPVRWLLRKYWTPEYEATQKVMLSAMDLEAPPPLADRAGCRCTIS